MRPICFALTSWGNAGIPWISKCLNLHPEIRTYVNRKPILERVTGRELDVLSYLDALEELSEGYAVFGDLNGVSPHEFAAIHGKRGDAFRGAHLIAHPIPRFAGSLAYSREMDRHFSHQHFLELWRLDRGDSLSGQLLRILGERGDHVPAHYMMHVNGIAQLRGEVPFYRLERLMSEDGEWETMVEYLSAGTVSDFGALWRRLQGVFIGVAHEAFRLGSPVEAWHQLPLSTQRVVSTMLSPVARQVYGELGYDLSFVPN